MESQASRWHQMVTTNNRQSATDLFTMQKCYRGRVLLAKRHKVPVFQLTCFFSVRSWCKFTRKIKIFLKDSENILRQRINYSLFLLALVENNAAVVDQLHVKAVMFASGSCEALPPLTPPLHSDAVQRFIPSRLATTDSRPVPAPISSTALSIRLTCCWLFSRNWHRATACNTNLLSVPRLTAVTPAACRGRNLTPGQIRAPYVSIDSRMVMSWPAKWKDSLPRAK